jgi:hypothetical protein
MHVPNLPGAIAEICRVTKTGGKIIVAEVNMYSMQSLAKRFLQRFVGSRNRPTRRFLRQSSGIERWRRIGGEEFLTRESNVPALVDLFRPHGVHLEERMSGEFTQMYTIIQSETGKMILHSLNQFWFRHQFSPKLAAKNILILAKQV